MESALPVFPTILDPYDSALRAAVREVMESYEPIAIIGGGSVLRGQGGPNSDIDLYVLHRAAWRQRLQRRYHGVPFEIFINPPQQVRRYFEEEHAAGRPITAHILSTGFVVLDRDPALQMLKAEAVEWLARLPEPGDDALRWRRYTIVDELDNAGDIIETDPACASMILHNVAARLIEYAFLANRRTLPRQKATLAALDELDASAGARMRAFYTSNDAREQLRLATELARELTGAVTFFEWDSARLPV